VSNVFRNTGITYFQLPQAIIDNELLPEISGSAFKLFAFLCSEAQRMSDPTVTISGLRLSDATGIAPTRIGSARRELVDHWLIKSQKMRRGHAYTICDSQTGAPIPSNESTALRVDFNDLSQEQLRAYFVSYLKNVKDKGGSIEACCPFHDDTSPSLRISLKEHGDWYCHGCLRKGKLIHFQVELAALENRIISLREARKEVVDTLRHRGIINRPTAEPEARYQYRDEWDELVFEVLRYPGKRFGRRRPDPKHIGKYIYDTQGCPDLLYHLPEVCEARTVFVTEGERDADTLSNLNIRDYDGYIIPGTTNAGGAGKWKSAHRVALTGKKVILVADNDDIGLRHIDLVESSLIDVAKETIRLQIPLPYKDVSAFMVDHHVHDLMKLLPAGCLEEGPEI
jgi:hypothetical protein